MTREATRRMADRQATRAEPATHSRAKEVQAYGTIAKLPIALDERVAAGSISLLNQILADTMTLRDLYKKHHWQVAGPTFYQLHLLYDKHYDEQAVLVDAIGERIQLLGGSASPWRRTWPRPPGSRDLREGGKTCRPRYRGCSRRTRW